MGTLITDCPLCGLALPTLTLTGRLVVTENDKAARPGGHLHIAVTGRVACLNGHQWQGSDDFLLSRQEA